MGLHERAYEWRALPSKVAWFRTRATGVARRISDDFSLLSVMRPDELGHLIRLARGRRFVVELGTGTAWTTVSLALADSARTVVSYDPVVWDTREHYLELAGSARERISLIQQPGESGPQPEDPPTELVFIDSSHDREQTLAEFAAWREALAAGAIVAFHDYDEPAYPGVTEAVRELGLQGETFGHLFVWTAD
jgi:Methyltransferase domain